MKNTHVLTAAALQLLLVSSAPGQWTLVEDFDALTPGNIIGQNGWGGDADIIADVAFDPTDGGNQTLSYASPGIGNANVYKTAISIEDGTSGTVFMRLNVASGGDADAPFGLSSNDTPDWGATQFGGKLRDTGGNLAVRTSSDVNLATGLAYGTWYNLWLVVNPGAGTPDPDGTITFYLQRDGDPTYDTQVNIGSDNARSATTDIIDTIAFHKWNANGPIHIDDIFYHDGAGPLNLINPIDSDGDGLPDGWELLYFPALDVGSGGTDGTGNADTDNWTDAQEFANATNPTDEDTDNDGLNDDVEGIHNTDPLVADTDGDGLDDGSEVNTHSTQPDTYDSDNDGVSDGIEVAQGSLPNDNTSQPASLGGTGLWTVTVKEAEAEAINTLSLADDLFSGAITAWPGSMPPAVTTGTFPNLNFSVGTNGAADGFTNPGTNNFRFAGNVAMPVPAGQGFILHNAAIKAGGHLLAEVDGTYTFNSVSDDGSRLTIDGQVVDANDQPQGVQDRLVQVDLLKGFHTVEYLVFQGGGDFAQELSTHVLPGARNSVDDIRDWKLVPAADLVTDTAGGGNGLPDEWEDFYGITSGPTGDDDGDLLDNAGELAQLSSPLVSDTDGDGLDDQEESTLGANPRNSDTDGDGLTDKQEADAGTDPILVDSDADGFSDPQEIAAGTSPTSNAEVPTRYVQTFDSFSDGETALLDGSSISGNQGQASVQGQMLRILQDDVASSFGTFQIPPLAGSDQQWSASFDYQLDEAPGGGIPADGFSLNYGPIAGLGQATGGNEETGFKVNETVAFSTSTYTGGGNQGQRIYEQVAGGHSIINNPSLAEIPGVIINNGQTTRGRVTATFDGSGKLVDFSTTGMVTNAAFDDFITAILAAQTHNWAVTGRTGGATHGLMIDNVAVIAGANSIDGDDDGLIDAWELSQGLDPTTAADGVGVDSDGDTLTNGQEFDAGTNPTEADIDGDGANDAQELAAGSRVWDPDTDDDGLNDGDEIAFGSSPLLADEDGDGLTDPVEQANGTDPKLVDSDADGHSDAQEIAAGTSPLLNTEQPSTYFQDFNAFADGTRALVDGSSVEGTGTASVQGGDFRLLEDNVNGQATILRLPPLDGSAQGWCLSMDFTMESIPGGPADGFSMSYGPIAGIGTGGANEGGFRVNDTVICSIFTYTGAGNQGVRLYEQVGDVYGVITNPITAEQVGATFSGGQTVSGRFTTVFDGSGNLISWSTTGTNNDAFFENFVTAITAGDPHTWALAGRTGGLNQGLIIHTLAITAGAANIDSDSDGLLDAWELTQGLDPNSATDGAGANSDNDLYTNGEEFDRGLDPLDPSDGGGVQVTDPAIDSVALLSSTQLSVDLSGLAQNTDYHFEGSTTLALGSFLPIAGTQFNSGASTTATRTVPVNTVTNNPYFVRARIGNLP